MISLILNFLSIIGLSIKPLKEYFDKKKLNKKIEDDVLKLSQDLDMFIKKVKNQGRRLRKDETLKEMLDLLARIRPLKISIIEYCRSYSNSSEKTEIKELLYSLDCVAKVLFEIEKPSQFKQFTDDVRVEQGLKLAFGKKSEIISASFKKINWSKYPKDYFKDLKNISQEIYEIGRPYDF